jgi:hypothetical protein
VHIVTEFIIFPAKGKGKEKKAIKPACEKEHFIPNLSNPPSGADTPVTGVPLPPKTPEEVVRRLAAAASARERPDGGVVTCIAVTDYCFKQGRITIPPRIAMFLSLLSPDEKQRDFAMSLLKGKDRGAAFARGGWREHPDADKFGRDVALGEDGTQNWAEEGRMAMENVDESLKMF